MPVGNSIRHILVTSVLVFWSLGSSLGGTTTEFGPSPYHSEADSPFNLSRLGTTFFLEDFEDGLLNTSGIQLDAGDAVIFPPGHFTDSVDADDGVIDGSGREGYSLLDSGVFIFPPLFNRWIGFYFDADRLGFFPTAFGLVWTDGPPDSFVGIISWNADGELIAHHFYSTFTIGLGDSSDDGGTLEDRFLGIRRDDGIARALIASNHFTDGRPFEIDHVQYGLFLVPEATTPTILLAGLVVSSVFVFRRRKPLQ